MKLWKLSLATVILLLAACGSNPGGNSYDPAKDPFFTGGTSFGGTAPEGATVIPPEEFKKKFEESGAKFLTEAELAAIRAAEQQRAREDEATVSDYVSQRTQLANFLLADEDGSINPDGDHLRRVNTKNGPATFVTLGRKSRLAALAGQIRVFPTKENQLGLYEANLKSISDFLNEYNNGDFTLEQYGLVTPDAAKNLSAGQLYEYNSRISDIATQFGIGSYARLIKDPNLPSEPETETGVGNQLDRTTRGHCSEPSAQGIFKNFDWPLKPYTTSVKDQGNRGTCWGFANTAALEQLIAKKNKRWVNLSEQDYAATRFLSLQPRTFGDGGDAYHLALESWKKGYEFAYEKGWEYNKSYSRTEVENPKGSGNWQYQMSCNGFSDTCSDTNHQGQFFCANIPLLGTFCFWTPKSIKTRSGFVIANEPRQVWDFENTQRSTVILLLRTLFSGVTVLGIDARYFDSFSPPDANGFVPYVNPRRRYDDKSKTTVDDIGVNHYVLLVGYISNESLLKKLPNAPQGEGGGYFILKNSWGDCWGDAGYAYVPWRWIERYVGQAILFD